MLSLANFFTKNFFFFFSTKIDQSKDLSKNIFFTMVVILENMHYHSMTLKSVFLGYIYFNYKKKIFRKSMPWHSFTKNS
jgi:hypothetical protein